MIQSLLFKDEDEEEEAAVVLTVEAQEALIREMAKMLLAIHRMERKSDHERKEHEHNA